MDSCASEKASSCPRLYSSEEPGTMTEQVPAEQTASSTRPKSPITTETVFKAMERVGFPLKGDHKPGRCIEKEHQPAQGMSSGTREAGQLSRRCGQCQRSGRGSLMMIVRWE